VKYLCVLELKREQSSFRTEHFKALKFEIRGNDDVKAHDEKNIAVNCKSYSRQTR